MKKKLQKWRLFSIFAILALILSGCGKPYLSALTPAGEVAKKQYDLMILSTLIMVLVIVAVIVLFAIVIVRFRRRKGDETIPRQVEGNHKLEIIWTVIPIILLIVLAVPTVISTFDFADTKAMEKKDKAGKTKDALVVNVRANLYWWEFEYPDLGIVTSQELVVPTGQKVYFNLKASDVKHSFWIPAVGGKMDTNVDGVNKFWLEFDPKKSEDVGNMFYGKCAELCGPSHALMDFKVKTKSKADFNQWAADMKAVKKPAAVGNLAKEGEAVFNKSCIGCHAVTPTDARPEKARQAPNLANFGERERIAGVLKHNEENLKKWLQNPEEYKPGNKMTGKYGKLTDQQLDALSAYLMGLKVEAQ
ncbi:cytochrome c oxidase subunit II [Actinomycetes bacterium NPDC127524]|uniref:cytochrome c oxidase subunit II n=1 Tax=Bacillus sp. MUM 13 TaxID=1678001 RepID=UPI0008F5BD9E|nr:cytochrome c oxidase subunit II [Bacillus sp. MUM 13]OIK15158.1 cytochrome c oxidase subunit II [Bacillus sp. MUM 13]